jgi:hydrogenase/urease accessory protein HupE
MTTPLPATTAESRDAGARSAGLLPRVFAVFMVLHGLVHVVGFTVPWGLGGPRGIESSTRILNHSIEAGDTGVKLLGFIWLAAAVAFVAARRSAVALVLGSTVLCTVGLPGSIMGLAIDVVLLGLLLVASDRLIAEEPRRIR